MLALQGSENSHLGGYRQWKLPFSQLRTQGPAVSALGGRWAETERECREEREAGVLNSRF